MLKIGLKTALASLVILSLGLAGCGNTSTPPATSNQTTSSDSAKVLKVGTDPTFAPFEFMDDQNKTTGFDVELMNAIGADMGYKVQFESSSFDGLIPALQAGNYGAVIAAMTITPEREKSVDFSNKYLMAAQYIAVKKDSSIKSAADLKGKKIGVQNATTGQTVVEGMGITPQKYEAIPDAMNDLINGGLDAVVADSPVVLYFIKQNPTTNIHYINGDFSNEYYGIAVKKGDSELKDKINASLKKIQDSSKYNEIYKKWFNEDAPTLK
ncbi:basic amino acid ABC transporter substrate-binding protein [Desulfitobacterium sp.]|uniref:basic amino acid ABC transporter substrate-binding protein n=1 Tax=Desulfitobacterium sp. TaxID=49981 RepID=UPI002B8FC581|nr:transporter substrate-binding domain-containing protein [Desulfitobacterium sp.]HVJ47983.1 transporter substrate-binding domain-containing protein [Desulfitobacterium sp.]